MHQFSTWKMCLCVSDCPIVLTSLGTNISVMPNTDERAKEGNSKGVIRSMYASEFPTDYLYVSLILCIQKTNRLIFYGVIITDSRMIV